MFKDPADPASPGASSLANNPLDIYRTSRRFISLSIPRVRSHPDRLDVLNEFNRCGIRYDGNSRQVGIEY